VIVDPRQIKPKQQLMSVQVPEHSHDLARDERWLYIAASSGLYVYDSLEQEIVASLTDEGFSRLVLQGDRLYLIGDSKTVSIVDVADPRQPQRISRFQPRSSMQNITLAADRLAISGTGGVSVYLLSASEQLELLDHYPLERATDVFFADGLIYVAADLEGVIILELTGKGKLREVGRSVPPWPMSEFASAQELLAVDGFVYLANGSSGLSVIDVRVPSQPEVVSSLRLPGYALGLDIHGQRLAVSCRFAGVHYVDIREPRQPKLLGKFNLLDASRGVLLEAEQIFLAGGNQGVSVFPAPVEMKRLASVSSTQLQVEFPDVDHPGRYSLQVGNGRELSVVEGAANLSRRNE
jgi:hypothetical protein